MRFSISLAALWNPPAVWGPHSKGQCPFNNGGSFTDFQLGSLTVYSQYKYTIWECLIRCFPHNCFLMSILQSSTVWSSLTALLRGTAIAATSTLGTESDSHSGAAWSARGFRQCDSENSGLRRGWDGPTPPQKREANALLQKRHGKNAKR